MAIIFRDDEIWKGDFDEKGRSFFDDGEWRSSWLLKVRSLLINV
jgi:hypothetical protein